MPGKKKIAKKKSKKDIQSAKFAIFKARRKAMKRFSNEDLVQELFDRFKKKKTDLEFKIEELNDEQDEIDDAMSAIDEVARAMDVKI